MGERYEAYLRSPHWQRVKENFKAKKRCFLCHNKKDVHLHHKRYTRRGESILGWEKPRDLRWLCKTHHFKIHKYGLEKEFMQMKIKRVEFRKWLNSLPE